MANNKRLPLSEIRRRLREQPARQTPAHSDEDDAASLFARAVSGATELPPDDRADIRRTPPPPTPRPRDAALEDLTAEAPRKADNPLALPDSWFASTTASPLDPESAALRYALSGITPIRNTRIELERPRPRPLPIQHELDERAALAESIYAPTPLELRLEGGDELHYLKDGTPRSVLRDLRRGRWVVQAQIDLHGANRDEAREMLASAMAQWRKREIRTVRIIHGKGLGSPGKEPVLKKLVAGWLMNYDDVVAYCQARVHDGGAGALIALLRATRR